MLNLFLVHLAGQVYFVTNHVDESVLASSLPDEIVPLVDAFEGGFATDVEDDETAVSIPDIGWDEGSEPLLARRVPQLESNGFPVDLQCFGYEIDAHSRLHYH